MVRIDISSGGHRFEKTNLVTKYNGKKCFDEYKCLNCGMIGRSYQLGSIDISDKYNYSNIELCKNRIKEERAPSRIRIIFCNAHGAIFRNLTPASEHQVIETPKGEKLDNKGVWVMGVGEPVKVLNSEFEVIEYKNEK